MVRSDLGEETFDLVESINQDIFLDEELDEDHVDGKDKNHNENMVAETNDIAEEHQQNV